MIRIYFLLKGMAYGFAFGSMGFVLGFLIIPYAVDTNLVPLLGIILGVLGFLFGIVIYIYKFKFQKRIHPCRKL